MTTPNHPKAHTPGPWAFHERDLTVFDIPVKIGVATLLKQFGEDSDRETNANGYLIAAAPVMYDALLIAEEAVRAILMLLEFGSEQYSEYERTLSILQMSIAHAEGQA